MISCPLYAPQSGIKPTTQESNPNFLVHRMLFNHLSHSGQANLIFLMGGKPISNVHITIQSNFVR